MIVKSGSTPATKEFHLSFLDQNIVRVYTQTLSIFPFPDQNNAEAAIQALQDGLRLTLRKFPHLAGILTLADAKSGRLALHYPAEIMDEVLQEVFRSKQIYKSEQFPFTYEELKQQGMPPSAFKGTLFVPDDFENYPVIPPAAEGILDFKVGDAPVMRVQACFIPGGLVLSNYIHHTVMDCSGVTTFWTVLAANVLKVASSGSIGNEEQSAPESIADEQSIDRLTLENRVPIFTEGVPNADCYFDGTFKYNQTLPSDTTCSQRFLVIPAERIRQYRERLRPYFPAENPPTMCNVLAALVWTHVTRARSRRLMVSGYTHTNLGVATDLRKRQEPPVRADYMGNMAIFSRATLNISDLAVEDRVTEKTILPVIKKIKETIASVDHNWIGQQLGFFKSIRNIEDTECALALRFGPDMYITSWLNFAADLRWGIPGTDLEEESLAGRPEFIRRSYNPSDGGMIFLPRRRVPVKGVEAPFEVLVRLATEDMDRLLSEEGGLRSWTEGGLRNGLDAVLD